MVQSTTFNDLPDDVLVGCLIFLDARDLLRCRQVRLNVLPTCSNSNRPFVCMLLDEPSSMLAAYNST